MQGLGNDFVMLDCMSGQPVPSEQQIRAIADRKLGVGFDQLICLQPGRPDTAVSMSIYNADGSAAEQCGNGVRCLALFARRRGHVAAPEFGVFSSDRVIQVRVGDDGNVSANMGVPLFEPDAIPFQAEALRDWYDVDVGGEMVRLGAVSMGNPHAVVPVQSMLEAPVDRLGPKLESHIRFPQRANVGFARFASSNEIDLRVFERGVGETRACGTGACAAVAVGQRQGLLANRAKVNLLGGSLDIEWQGGQTPVWMTGPATWVYEGKIEV